MNDGISELNDARPDGAIDGTPDGLNVGAVVLRGAHSQLRATTRAHAPSGAARSDPAVRAQVRSSDSEHDDAQNLRSFAFCVAVFFISNALWPKAIATASAPLRPQPDRSVLMQVLCAKRRAYSPNHDCILAPTITAHNPTWFSVHRHLRRHLNNLAGRYDIIMGDRDVCQHG